MIVFIIIVSRNYKVLFLSSCLWMSKLSSLWGSSFIFYLFIIKPESNLIDLRGFHLVFINFVSKGVSGMILIAMKLKFLLFDKRSKRYNYLFDANWCPTLLIYKTSISFVINTSSKM